MRQEHVSLQNVQVSQLYDLIKKYLEDLKLEIIHEEKYENYWSLKAHKGGKGSVIIGNVREVEVMISGADSNYDLILRTGAWGRDIIVPAPIASVFSLGVGAAVRYIFVNGLDLKSCLHAYNSRMKVGILIQYF